MEVAEYEAKTIGGLLDKIQEIISSWKVHPSDVWYRGIASESFALKPGIVWRDIKNTAFIDDFLLSYENYNHKIEDAWQLYSLMQHYGMPTRLLDWTQSPLTALYFALENESAALENKRVIWAICPAKINKNTKNGEYVFNSLNEGAVVDQYLPASLSPAHLKDISLPSGPIALKIPQTNKRIKSQQGCFTVHGSATESIDQYLVDGDTNYAAKIIIKESDRKKFQKNLYALSYKEDDVYQDLNSLSRRIMREHGIKP